MIFEQDQPIQTITATKGNTFFEQLMKSGINAEKLKLFQLMKPTNFIYTNSNAQDFVQIQIQSITTAQIFEKKHTNYIKQTEPSILIY